MNRALSALGLARRAGKLNWGFDTAVEAMRSGACGVVILATSCTLYLIIIYAFPLFLRLR